MMPLSEILAAESVGLPIVSALIALPVLCAVIVLFVQGQTPLRWGALAAALLELLLAMVPVLKFERGVTHMQFVERHPWMPALHVEYHVGIDGISLLFIPLTAFLTVLVILSSWKSVQSKLKAYLVALLVVESITMGIFCSLDMVLFFVFWELLLVPTYFLISLWGIGPERRHAAFMYFIYMAVGSAPMLLGIVLLGINHAHHAPAGSEGSLYSFDYIQLLATPISAELQKVIFFLLFLAFIVKSPVVPFHTWLPGALVEGPIGMGVLLIGIKIGPYGILRFVLPLLPDAAAEFAWLIMTLGLLTAVYGSLVALVQTNLRRLLAYVSVSHVGLVIVGFASQSTQGLQGSLVQAVNMGFTSTGLLLLAGFLHSRLGSSELGAYGGLAKRAPILAGFFLLLGMAGAGLPGTCGFIGEHLILLGAFQWSFYTAALALTAAILGAGYFLGYFERAFLGPITRPLVAAMEDLRAREILVVAALAVMVLCGGLYPAPFVDASSASIGALARRMNLARDPSPPVHAAAE
jgi:NADH-quinone oxidoreductase subunit M